MRLAKKKVKIQVNNIIEWGYAILFIFFIPTFISRVINIPYWGTICYLCILLMDAYFIFKRKYQSELVFWTFAFYGYFVLITLFKNSGEVLNATMRLFNAVSFVIIVEYIFNKFEIKKTVSIFMKSMEIFNYLNLLFMIIYPAGMYKVVTNGVYEEIVKVDRGAVRTNARVLWLLGHQTTLSRFTLPAISIALIYCFVKKGKFEWNIRSVMLIAVCLLETIFANSAGNYILLGLFVMLLVMFKFHGKIKTVYIYIAIVATYVFFLTASGQLALFDWMSKSMQRSVQISTRLPIWINTIKYWMEKPIFGWGYINESSDTIRRMLTLGNPHSSYLWALFEGGIVGLLLMILFLQKITKGMKKYWNINVARIIFAVFVCFMVGMIDDDYIFRFPQELMLFSMVYHIPKYASNQIKKN